MERATRPGDLQINRTSEILFLLNPDLQEQYSTIDVLQLNNFRRWHILLTLSPSLLSGGC
jgi:hypothetical protein